MNTFATACLLMLAVTSSAKDPKINDYNNEHRYKEVDLDLAKSNLKLGDCLGLSPVIFGSPGPYVTSDL